jgi:peroxiredoxin Q/BCP
MNTPSLIALIVAIGICFASLCHGKCGTKNELKVGDKAPDLSLIDKDGNAHRLADWRGKKIALYFYPKDSTPGCTEQACSIRDNFEDLTDAGITIIGLSKGSKKSKTRFAEKQHLPFPLLLATEDTLKSYGVNGSIFTLFLPKRRTFLIDEQGIIVAIIDKVDTKNHARQILNGFKNAQ